MKCVYPPIIGIKEDSDCAEIKCRVVCSLHGFCTHSLTASTGVLVVVALHINSTIGGAIIIPPLLLVVPQPACCNVLVFILQYYYFATILLLFYYYHYQYHYFYWSVVSIISSSITTIPYMLLVRVIHTYWYDVLTVLYVFFVGGLITRVWAKRYKKNRKKSCIIFFFVAWLHNNTNNTNNTDLVYYLLSALWFVVVPLLVHYNTYCNIIQESNPSSCTTLHTYLFAQTHKHTNTSSNEWTNLSTGTCLYWHFLLNQGCI